ncbi:MAG: hypothetical protein EBV53_15975 [Proteobacteria bacterium]|nr:hypothetical protein [Pseudomonadota bacterium]
MKPLMHFRQVLSRLKASQKKRVCIQQTVTIQIANGTIKKTILLDISLLSLATMFTWLQIQTQIFV